MFQYTREQLLNLNNAHHLQLDNSIKQDLASINYGKITIRKRGKRGGIRNRVKKRGHRTALPSVILSNVQSINNKINELHTKVAYLSEYRNSSVICLTETWLTDKTPSSAVTPPGFALIRADRDVELSDKHSGGGLCILVNNKWCTNSKTIDQFCLPKLEYLVVRSRPFYLPRELSCINFVITYFPEGYHRPSVEHLHDVISNIETDKPDSAILVLGDFNDVKLRLPGYSQYVNCSTRSDKTLDLCYCNIRNAYKCTKRDPLGISDHHSIVLTPCYKQKLKQQKPTVKTIKKWSEDAEQSLQACFDCTDWSVFCDSSDSIEDHVDVISDYINFCEDNIIPTKTVKIYPNNKPWFNSNIKAKLLKKKQQTSLSNNRALLKDIQSDLNTTIEASKAEFKKKLETQFKGNNTREAWRGLELVTQYKPKSSSLSDDDSGLVDELNNFYARFDTNDNSEDIQAIKNVLAQQRTEHDRITISSSDVYKHFKSLNPRKSKGPDGISPKTLRICSQQLSPVYATIYQRCVNEHIPNIWKTATVIPVPKKSSPKELNDYRPISLTSVPFKTLERIVQERLSKESSKVLDNLQFAYQKKRSVEDATLTLTNLIYKHLERPNTYARTLFIDFSSAFNTIKPHILIGKLLRLGISPSLCTFVLDFITERRQTVKIGNKLSSVIVINTGSPQGCVLSALLFILYTNDLHAHSPNCYVLKYADDTAIIGLLSGENETSYLEEINKCIEWCDQNNLLLNATKTKELIIDFRKCEPSYREVTIKDSKVDRVNKFKYLGTIIDNKLSWSDHLSSVESKFHQRLYFLRFLKSFNVDNTILHLFYKSVVESIALFNLITYWSNLNTGQKNIIRTLQKRARKITRTDIAPIDLIYNHKCVQKVKSLMKDNKHPLACEYTVMRSGKRLRVPSCRCARFRNAFIPNSIIIYNASIVSM